MTNIRRLALSVELILNSFMSLCMSVSGTSNTVKMGCFGFLKTIMFFFNGIIFVSTMDLKLIAEHFSSFVKAVLVNISVLIFIWLVDTFE